jgi:paraquat-inducible protein A
MSREEDSLVVCEQCGMAHRWIPLTAGAIARCVRCEAVLGRGHRLELRTVLALTITAGVAFLVGISTDVLTLTLRGTAEAATLPGAIAATWRSGQEIVAIVAALTALVAPALFIALRLYVLVPLATGKAPRAFALGVRILHHAGRWNMVEVFTIGVLLSLVRLVGIADVSPGPGLFALGAVTFLFAAIESAGLKHLWWQLR